MPQPSPFDAHFDFLLMCDIPDDDRQCWAWSGPESNRSRPVFWNRRTYLWKHTASKAAYRLFIGEVPPGFHVEHMCEQPWCVNPWHLDAVPPKVNYDRLRRTHCKNGHELTDDNRLDAGPTGHGQSRRSKCRTCAKDRENARTIRRRASHQKAA